MVQSVAITGASSGLGASLAKAFAGPGVTLGLIGRDAARLAATAEACTRAGATVRVGALDVTDAAALGAWLVAHDEAAPLDLLIANAGISAGPPPDATSEGLALAARQVTTNLLGAMNTIEPLIPAFVARRRGRIAIVSSLAGYRGLAYSPGYSASKAGNRAYGEGLRALLAPHGVGVSVICPGFFDTPMTDRFKGSHPFMMSLDAATRVVVRGLARGKRRIVFPWPLAFGMRAADLMPAWLGDIVIRNFHFHIEPP
ncbi:MAG: SDR family NAD(P)-dependent oxidoreductase [Alphaproteobacteria bacterium]|nr:SDR family NAD(P)-dependent oxidoreductase [Alphaproteobacteria bacterium]